MVPLITFLLFKLFFLLLSETILCHVPTSLQSAKSESGGFPPMRRCKTGPGLPFQPRPCTLHSLWCMPGFSMARANVLQEQSFKLAQQKLCWALAVVSQEGGNMVRGRRRVARGRYSLLDTGDVKLVRWAQLRLQVLVVLTLVTASSWAKASLGVHALY